MQGRKLASRRQGWPQPSLLGALQQPSDLSWESRDRGAAQETPSAARSPGARPRFLSRDEGRQGPLFFPNQGEDEAGIIPAQSVTQQIAFSSLGEAPSHSSANLCVLGGRVPEEKWLLPLPHLSWSSSLETCPPEPEALPPQRPAGLQFCVVLGG